MQPNWTDRSFFYQCWALAGRIAVINIVAWLVFFLLFLLIAATMAGENGVVA